MVRENLYSQTYSLLFLLYSNFDKVRRLFSERRFVFLNVESVKKY